MKKYTPYNIFHTSLLAIVRVPKCGCTSLSLWSRKVEREARRRSGEDPDADLFEKVNSLSEVPPGILRIATIRHPVDRVVSVFFNKLVKAPDSYWVFEFIKAPWFPRLRSLEELRHSFRNFVHELRDNDHFRKYENMHWTPLTEYLPDLADSDIVMHMEQLFDLPALVASYRNDLSWVRDIPMDIKRKTESILKDLVLEEDLVDVIEATYAGDMQLLDQFGIPRVINRKVGVRQIEDLDAEAEVHALREERRIAYHGLVDLYHRS